ncbi:MAG: hypothetical protein CMC08_06020 [Flavobacteriaceae bacterium]|nr:hypothetical protein [Flavobacteriaceae bacterium]
MKRKAIYILALTLLAACGGQSPSSQLQHLAGYWEISSVTLPNGVKKEFTLNTTVDFIEVSDSTGTRQKLNPQLDGSFRTTGTVESFDVTVSNDTLMLLYHTPFDNRKEWVLEASEEELLVKNPDGKVYTYKKFRKFNLTEE